MSANAPSDIEYWRASALRAYVAYLACQPFDITVFDRMAAPAWEARKSHNDAQLIALLQETGDRSCLESAERYPGCAVATKPEK